MPTAKFRIDGEVVRVPYQGERPTLEQARASRQRSAMPVTGEEFDRAFPSQSEFDQAFPAKTAAAPPGFAPEGFEPESASPLAAQSPALQRSPVATAPAMVSPGEDAVGRLKAFLTAEPPPGTSHGALQFGPDLGPAVRATGRFLLPETYEQAATAAILGAPGKGLLPALGRIGSAGTAGAGISALKGKGALTGGVEQGVAATGGEALGGLTRFGARQIGSVFSRTTDRLGDWISQAVPAFSGKSARETIRNVFSGEGQAALSKEYRSALDTLIRDAGDPLVNIPALPELGRSGPNRQMPAFMSASEAQTAIASLKRSLSGATGMLARRKGALEEISHLEDAEEQLHSQLAALKPQQFAAFQEQAKAYFRGKAIQRMFGYGRDVPTEARLTRLRGGKDAAAAGGLDEPMLERAFERARGELQRAFTPQEFTQLEQIIRRGETDPLAISTPGKGFNPRFHLGFVPTLHTPKAPVRIGAPEQQADLFARAIRILGGLQGGQLLHGSP